MALAWDGSKPELAGKTFDDYVACPVRMALALAGGVSGAGGGPLYVREMLGGGGRTARRGAQRGKGKRGGEGRTGPADPKSNAKSPDKKHRPAPTTKTKHHNTTTRNNQQNTHAEE